MDQELKPPLSYEEQISLLRSRGLLITDDVFAEKILSHVNYYRLSAYSLGLRNNDVFNENITLDSIYELYQFDATFRYMLFELIEMIEITFRTKIAYHLAFKYDSLAYLNSDIFENELFHSRFLEDFEKEKNRQRDTAFVKHHIYKYSSRMPIWVATELFSFGMLSKFYSNMKDEDKKAIVASLDDGQNQYPVDTEYLKSWLLCLVNLRNICAHYGRIYNRNLNGVPKLHREHSNINRSKVFAALIVIKRLMYDKSKWEMFVINLMALLEEYTVVNLKFLGFPDNWEEILYDRR